MKVLELTQRFPPGLGGVENHVMNLASRLTQRGVATEVLTTDLLKEAPFQRIVGKAPPFPFEVKRFRAFKILEAPHGLGIVAPSMVRGVLSRSPDLIHAHAYGYFPTFVGALARMVRRVPLVVTPHSDPGRPSLGKHLFDRTVPLLTLRQAQRVIAVTGGEATYLERLGVPRDRLAIIPNGIDLGEFASLDGGHRSRGEATILFVGRCYPRQKGLEPLVRAMALLPPASRARLRIVGEDWGGFALVRSLGEALGIGDRITLVGPLARRKLLEEYAQADVLVLPSLFEPFGIVLLEAMAAGLPVVASRVGGIVEIVEDGRTGLLVEPGDARGLAGALGLVLEDEGLRRTMGARARQRAPLYSWDALVPRIEKVYAEAIAEGGG